MLQFRPVTRRDGQRKAAHSMLGAIMIVGVTMAGLSCAFTPRRLQAMSLAQGANVSPNLLRQMQSAPNTPSAGNSVGAVLVMEFFDYRCPYCRIMQPRLDALVAKDKRVRLVFKDWPIFGGASVYAARAALAAQWQGKYLAANEALFALPRTMDEASIRTALANAGVDIARLDRDLVARGGEIDAQLRQADSEARSVGFQGTPGFVVGTIAVPGALTEDQLETLIDQVAAH